MTSYIKWNVVRHPAPVDMWLSLNVTEEQKLRKLAREMNPITAVLFQHDNVKSINIVRQFGDQIFNITAERVSV